MKDNADCTCDGELETPCRACGPIQTMVEASRGKHPPLQTWQPHYYLTGGTMRPLGLMRTDGKAWRCKVLKCQHAVEPVDIYGMPRLVPQEDIREHALMIHGVRV